MIFFKKIIFTLFIFSVLVSTNSQAGRFLAASAKNQTLWSQWYVYTAGNQPFGYYREDTEYSPEEKKFSIQQQWWEKDELNGITETFLGSIAQDDAKLTPVAFYVEKKKSAGGMVIQGRISKQNLNLSITGLGGQPNPMKQNFSIGNNTFLSAYLAMFLMKKNQPGKIIPYTIILEEGDDGKFSPQRGIATITKTAEKIDDVLCQQIKIKFKNLDSTWWVSKEGKLCRAKIPSIGVEIAAVTEAQAKVFLR